MDKIYMNPAHPSSFGGINSLYSAVKTKSTKAKVVKYLKKNATYRKFKKNKTKFRRARIYTTSIGVCFQGDIFDFQSLGRYNDSYRYILLIVDCLSRMIYARPVKRKTAAYMAEAMSSIFSEIKSNGTLAPRSTLGTDLGSEFWNEAVDKVYEVFDIAHFALRPVHKAALAESSGGILKQRVYRYLHAYNTMRWVDKLDDFVRAKNNRPNRSLGMAPSEINYENQSKVFDKLYPDKPDTKEAPLAIGTKVQLALDSLPFAKAYHGHFGDQMYAIKRQHDHNGIFRYTIEDLSDGQEISGTYYGHELLAMPD